MIDDYLDWLLKDILSAVADRAMSIKEASAEIHRIHLLTYRAQQAAFARE